MSSFDEKDEMAFFVCNEKEWLAGKHNKITET